MLDIPAGFLGYAVVSGLLERASEGQLFSSFTSFSVCLSEMGTELLELSNEW